MLTAIKTNLICIIGTVMLLWLSIILPKYFLKVQLHERWNNPLLSCGQSLVVVNIERIDAWQVAAQVFQNPATLNVCLSKSVFCTVSTSSQGLVGGHKISKCSMTVRSMHFASQCWSDANPMCGYIWVCFMRQLFWLLIAKLLLPCIL